MSHLILQGPRLDRATIEKIAALVQADGVQELGPTAVRLLGADQEQAAQVRVLAQAAQMDLAFLDQIDRLKDMRVLAMDMDSTLINIECIDEIADMAGRKEQVATITEAAMRGEIKDFSESLIRRVAFLEGVSVSDLTRVYQERLQPNPGAERLVATAHAHGVQTLLVSGGFTFFTERMKDRLSLNYAHSNTLEVVDGVLTGKVLGDIVDGQAKARYLQELAAQLGAEPAQCIAIGDGANDLPMMAQAGYSVAYRAKPVVQEQARFALNHSPLDAVLNWFRQDV
ncbi:phosphoserine phosphatase SerB [Alcaligenes sp. SDU_A2]|uniref:phosphoserine phosphatase SerB n=1 Tax=Alcaligenes sp. SDU_A2 TaxID=3136634 RepID=UPI002BD687B0|nr:phosphoserine phosphatase SerB [Alcaligenes sp.]HRL26950.1 phosphoserine phosphatase SerB [Alcaligenes sp.]